MKIIVDKIESPPPHALTRRDVKAVLSVLPKAWDFSLPIVHLKATLPQNSDFSRLAQYDVLGGPRLTVCSRGIPRETVYKDILRELAIQGLHKGTRRGHRLSETEQNELDRFIQPLLEKVASASAEQEPPGRETLKDHYVYRRLEASGYTWREACQIVRAVEEEKRNPTSRKTANRIYRARQILLNAGIDPETMSVDETLNTSADRPL